MNSTEGEQPRDGSVLGWGDELLGGVQSPFSLSLSLIDLLSDSISSLLDLLFFVLLLFLPTLWVAGPIYRGPGPLLKYRAGREPTMAG